MTPIDLYIVPPSPPCRAVIIAAKYMNITVNLIHVDLMKDEQKEDWFVKLNPQHCLPTINDNGFILWESRAIMTYFANKYAPNNSIYPSEPRIRSAVDRLLQFDLNDLYRSLGDYLIPVVCEGKNHNPMKADKVTEAMTYLDSVLKDNPYVAGEHLTLADFSIYFSLEFAEEFQYDFCKYKNICMWYQKLQREISSINESANSVTMSERTTPIELNIHHEPNQKQNFLKLVKVTNNKQQQQKNSSTQNSSEMLGFEDFKEGCEHKDVCLC